MPIKIHGNYFENCGTGISAPTDSDLEIGANQFVACGKAIDLRDPPSLIRALGLRDETPMPLIREILAFVGATPRSELEVQSKSESIGLLKWLSAGADASTLASTVTALCKYVPAIFGSASEVKT